MRTDLLTLGVLVLGCAMMPVASSLAAEGQGFVYFTENRGDGWILKKTVPGEKAVTDQCRLPFDAGRIAPGPDAATLLLSAQDGSLHWLRLKGASCALEPLKRIVMPAYDAQMGQSGNKVVFSSPTTREDTNDIFLFDLASGRTHRLTADPILDNQPCLAGGKVYFQRRGGTFDAHDIWQMSPDGAGASVLLSTGRFHFDLDCSATVLAYVSNESGSYSIGLVRPDGSKILDWREKGKDAVDVALSPGSDTLAAIWADDSGWSIGYRPAASTGAEEARFPYVSVSPLRNLVWSR